MKNKEIQEERMKGYFIQATKEMLKGEGIGSISVRSIADRAGYSYATLYNYFKDLNELIFHCVNDFQEECKLFVENQTEKSTDGIDKIKASVMAYMGYFIEYPGIFELFYLAKVGDIGNKQNTINVIANSLDIVCEKSWNFCINQNLVEKEQMEKTKSYLRNIVPGMLLLYLNRRIPDTYKEFINRSSVQIDQIFAQFKI